jgi:phage terminase large subunit-like protein
MHNVKILIENASSGRQLIQELENEMPIIPINPVSSKINRFESVSFLFRNEKCKFPKFNNIEDFDFMNWLEEEVFSFPNSKNSDTVDTISQFLNFNLYKKNKNHDFNQNSPIRI